MSGSAAGDIFSRLYLIARRPVSYTHLDVYKRQVLLGGGAVFYYFKFVKPKQSVKGSTELEDFDFEDYDEDEPEADIRDCLLYTSAQA